MLNIEINFDELEKKSSKKFVDAVKEVLNKDRFKGFKINNIRTCEGDYTFKFYLYIEVSCFVFSFYKNANFFEVKEAYMVDVEVMSEMYEEFIESKRRSLNVNQ